MMTNLVRIIFKFLRLLFVFVVYSFNRIPKSSKEYTLLIEFRRVRPENYICFLTR